MVSYFSLRLILFSDTRSKYFRIVNLNNAHEQSCVYAEKPRYGNFLTSLTGDLAKLYV